MIDSAKLALHEAYCRRNIIRCKICDEPVEKSSIEEHDQEFHV
jgi:hypothetical protein